MPASALLAAVSVASLNLCADEYLLLLARPREIASVSYLSQDALESPLWQRAKGHHANRGSIEQVVARRPSVVLTMGGGGRSTSLLGSRLGIGVIDLKLPASVDDAAANLRAVSTALGEPARARPWLERLRRLRQTAPSVRHDAVWLSGGGLTLPVPSVGAEWLRLAGFEQRPVAGNRMTLEMVLLRPPKVLIRSRYRSGQLSRNARWLDHPIVRNADSRRIDTDGRAWTCMGPLMIGEVERLRRARQ